MSIADFGDEATAVDLLHLRNCESTCLPEGAAADALISVVICPYSNVESADCVRSECIKVATAMLLLNFIGMITDPDASKGARDSV